MASYADRLTRFQNSLTDQADLVFFPMGTDLDYLTGIHRDIPNYGRNLHPGMWLEGAWIAPGKDPILTVPRMTAEFGSPGGLEAFDVRVLGDWDDPVQLVTGILSELGVGDAPKIAVSDDAEAETLIELQALRPGVTFLSGTCLLRPLRVIKDADEIEKLREAGRITEAAFAATVKQMKIGMTELEVLSELDHQMKAHGSLGPSFTTSMYNTGPDITLEFGNKLKSWPRKLEPPTSVLFDFGAVLDGMCYDFGRTACMGEPSAKQLEVHRLIMESQAAGIAALKAGAVTCDEVDKAARDVLEDAGYDPGAHIAIEENRRLDGEDHAFLNQGCVPLRQERRFVHVPTDRMAQPFLTKGDTTLVQEGMIFTIEPSIFLDGDVSARVEDCIVARPGGGEALTGGFQELIVIA